MALDMNPSSGFNAFWDDTVSQFRAEAIENHLDDGDNLDVINTHVTGAVDADTLQAQYAYPFVWSIATNHSPAYATTATDHGDLSMRVVFFAADYDPDTALQKARVMGGYCVDNVEGSALVDDTGTAHAAKVELDDFQLDSRPTSGDGAQVKFAELAFSIDVERKYV